jgi:hypothetical protein
VTRAPSRAFRGEHAAWHLLHFIVGRPHCIENLSMTGQWICILTLMSRNRQRLFFSLECLYASKLHALANEMPSITIGRLGNNVTTDFKDKVGGFVERLKHPIRCQPIRQC